MIFISIRELSCVHIWPDTAHAEMIYLFMCVPVVPFYCNKIIHVKAAEYVTVLIVFTLHVDFNCIM